MITIKDLINKIKWDKRENPEDYTLTFIDFRKEKEISYAQIKRLEGNFMVLDSNGKEVEVPLHRVRKVKKKGNIIWQRKPKNEA
jgi:uncharacterized protein (UPF0248 family)